MAKDKTKTGVPNKHLHARISYLLQAATCLAAGQLGASPAASVGAPGKAIPQAGTTYHPASTSFLALLHESESKDPSEAASRETLDFHTPSFGCLPLHLSSHLVQVARKSTIRLHPSIKHSICKRCNTPLIEGQTCTKAMENSSKEGRKPCADMLVLECQSCGATKRWPIGAKRQERKTKRKQNAQAIGHKSTVAMDTRKDEPSQPTTNHNNHQDGLYPATTAYLIWE